MNFFKKHPQKGLLIQIKYIQLFDIKDNCILFLASGKLSAKKYLITLFLHNQYGCNIKYDKPDNTTEKYVLQCVSPEDVKYLIKKQNKLSKLTVESDTFKGTKTNICKPIIESAIGLGSSNPFIKKLKEIIGLHVQNKNKYNNTTSLFKSKTKYSYHITEYDEGYTPAIKIVKEILQKTAKGAIVQQTLDEKKVLALFLFLAYRCILQGVFFTNITYKDIVVKKEGDEYNGYLLNLSTMVKMDNSKITAMIETLKKHLDNLRSDPTSLIDTVGLVHAFCGKTGADKKTVGLEIVSTMTEICQITGSDNIQEINGLIHEFAKSKNYKTVDEEQIRKNISDYNKLVDEDEKTVASDDININFENIYGNNTEDIVFDKSDIIQNTPNELLPITNTISTADETSSETSDFLTDDTGYEDEPDDEETPTEIDEENPTEHYDTKVEQSNEKRQPELTPTSKPSWSLLSKLNPFAPSKKNSALKLVSPNPNSNTGSNTGLNPFDFKLSAFGGKRRTIKRNRRVAKRTTKRRPNRHTKKHNPRRRRHASRRLR